MLAVGSYEDTLAVNQELARRTLLHKDTLSVLKLVLVSYALRAKSQVINLSAICRSLDAKALNTHLIWPTFSCSQSTFSSEVKEPTLNTILTIFGNQIEMQAVNKGIPARAIPQPLPLLAAHKGRSYLPAAAPLHSVSTELARYTVPIPLIELQTQRRNICTFSCTSRPVCFRRARSHGNTEVIYQLKSNLTVLADCQRIIEEGAVERDILACGVDQVLVSLADRRRLRNALVVPKSVALDAGGAVAGDRLEGIAEGRYILADIIADELAVAAFYINENTVSTH